MEFNAFKHERISRLKLSPTMNGFANTYPLICNTITSWNNFHCKGFLSYFDNDDLRRKLLIFQILWLTMIFLFLLFHRGMLA